MNGHPRFRLLLVLCSFLLLGYPVWSLTRTHKVSAEVSNSVASRKHLIIHLFFATAPQEFTLLKGDSILLQGKSPQVEFMADSNFIVPAEGVDLLLKVKWPTGTARTAVEVQVMDEEKTVTDKTIWSERDLVQMVTIPGMSKN